PLAVEDEPEPASAGAAARARLPEDEPAGRCGAAAGGGGPVAPDLTRFCRGGNTMPFYEKGDVRIHYEEAGSGFPLLVIPGGGLNSTVAGLATHPFNPFDEFKGEVRVVAAGLRRAKGRKAAGACAGPTSRSRWSTNSLPTCTAAPAPTSCTP